MPPEIVDDSVKVDFEIREGHTEYIVIDAVEHVERADKFDANRIELLFDDTVNYWRRWISHAPTQAVGARWCTGPPCASSF